MSSIRPILFSGPMIRALLDGRKTQTRRVMKPQPSDGFAPEVYGTVHKIRDGQFVMRKGHPIDIGYGPINWDGDEAYPCPNGKPGDLLWVRETWADLRGGGFGFQFAYAASTDSRGNEIRREYGVKWKPSIHMPRQASRLTLRITDVRVLRLQDISESDARAEGRSLTPGDPAGYFPETWERINGPGSWDANTWVWALTFTIIKANVDTVA